MIYFIQPVRGGPVKVGHSSDVDRRRAELEAQYGCPMVMLGTIKGGRREEREIHERFGHLRIGRTEQFRPAADLMEFIGRPLLVDLNADVIEAMGAKVAVVVVKGNEEWKAWLERAAKHCRVTISSLIDLAAIDYVKNRGFQEEPPKR